MTAALLLAAFAGIGINAAEVRRLDKTVIINGDSFKVLGDQTEVLVKREGVVVAAGPDMHIAAIEAAKQASGCETVRYFSTTPGVFYLELSCP